MSEGTQPTRPSWRTVSFRQAFSQQVLPPDADWSWWAALAAFLVSFLVSGMVATVVVQLMPGTTGEAIANVVADITLLACLIGWLQFAHPGWAPRMGVPKDRGVDITSGIVGGLAIELVAVQLIAAYLLVPLLQALTNESVNAPDQVQADKLTTVGLIITGVFAIVVAPIVEEFFFRGMLFRSIRTHLSFVPAALISSVAFGAFHLALPGQPLGDVLLLAITMCFVGFGFAFLVERRGTILSSMAAHVAFNFIGYLGIVLGRR